MTIKTMMLAAAATTAFAGAASAQALPGASTVTYNFSGACNLDDPCFGLGQSTVSGQLVLGGYTPGQSMGLQPQNFEGFSYSSSVYPSFSIDYSDDLAGALGVKSGSYDVSFSGKGYVAFPSSGVPQLAGAARTTSQPNFTSDPFPEFDDFAFSSSTNGDWSLTDDGVIEDQGHDGVWSLEGGVPGAPEPEAWFLMVAGAAAAGGAMRLARRRRLPLAA